MPTTTKAGAVAAAGTALMKEAKNAETAKQIAVCQSINLRTVYKDLSNAIEQFYYFL